MQGALGSIPGQGTRYHMSQPKFPHVATRTQCSQINEFFFFLKKEMTKVTRPFLNFCKSLKLSLPSSNLILIPICQRCFLWLVSMGFTGL